MKIKDLYFIDPESVKRTAKAIQKNNPKIRYTVVLDDLAKELGYTSYNNYEHYLTNAMLSHKRDFNHVIPLTKIDSLKLISLKETMKDSLTKKGYFVDNFYFINRVIDEQRKGYLDSSFIDLRSYIYYLPFVYKEFNDIVKTDIIENSNRNLKPSIQLVVDYYKTLDMNEIYKMIRNLSANDDSDDYDRYYANFESLKTNLKTRGIHFYIKSILEDYPYDEGVLTKMIFDGYCVEKIEHELNLKLRLITNPVVVFFKKDIESELVNYFPFIKESVNEANPFIFGRHIDNTAFFAKNEHLYSNISVLGVPGSGKGAMICSILFQLLMNNRGFGVINTGQKNYMKPYVNLISNILNKQDDLFIFNEKSSLKSVSCAINNNKILLKNCVQDIDLPRDMIAEKGSRRFEDLLRELSEQFYSNKFRNRKIPYYILVEKFNYNYIPSERAIYYIKKLNSLNIFFIFDDQVYEKAIVPLCKTILISNSSYQWYTRSDDFDFKMLMKDIYDNNKIIGEAGPSKALNPVFTLIHDNKFVGQVITEIDNDLFNRMPPGY